MAFAVLSKEWWGHHRQPIDMPDLKAMISEIFADDELDVLGRGKW